MHAYHLTTAPPAAPRAAACCCCCCCCHISQPGTVLTQRALWCGCRQNLDDCLDKLQEIIDKAVEAVTPKEIDPEVAARVKRK
jgi:hypothetical protein